MIITIDGPSASGKSTAARQLAHKLGFYYLSSGLFFRALAYLLQKKYNYALEELANPDAKHVQEIVSHDFNYMCNQDGECILIDGKDITHELKNEVVDRAASILATNKMAREAIDKKIRMLSKNYSLVAEGRDMGSVVFPEADYKFYLYAQDEIRAKRWQKDQAKRGVHFSFDQALQAIKERDIRDQTRSVSPLQIPPNAIIIDNSHLSPDQTVDQLLKVILEKK